MEIKKVDLSSVDSVSLDSHLKAINICIDNMDISDFNAIKDILFNEFDDFWRPNVLKEELESENSVYFVCKMNNVIVGFVGLKVVLDNCDIMNIVTRRSYRNQGIGSLLLKKVIAYAKDVNISNIFLEVSDSNKPAIHLYKKFNFIEQGVRKDYYDNNNGINMVLNIK